MYEFETFCLKTTPHHFLAWVGNYLGQLHVLAIGGRAGFDDLTLMCTTQTEPGSVDFSKPHRFEIWGRYMRPGEKGQVVRDLFSFELWTLSDRRIKLKFRWWEPDNTERQPDGIYPDGVAIQVRKLLKSIKRDYGSDCEEYSDIHSEAAEIEASDGVATEEDGRSWHKGTTIWDTPTSGSVIQLPDGELIQAKKVELPLLDTAELGKQVQPGQDTAKLQEGGTVTLPLGERQVPQEVYTPLREFAYGKLEFGELLVRIPEIAEERNARNMFKSTASKYIRCAFLFYESGKTKKLFVIDWNLAQQEKKAKEREDLSVPTLDRAIRFLESCLNRIEVRLRRD